MTYKQDILIGLHADWIVIVLMTFPVMSLDFILKDTYLNSQIILNFLSAHLTLQYMPY